MKSQITAEDVLIAACELERRAFELYAGLAGKHSALSMKSALGELARMEKEHERYFLVLLKSLPKSARTAQCDIDTHKHLDELMDSCFDKTIGEKCKSDDICSLLETALGMEEKSIAFYNRLKPLVPENKARSEVDRIIGEEKLHLRLIAGMLKKMA